MKNHHICYLLGLYAILVCSGMSHADSMVKVRRVITQTPAVANVQNPNVTHDVYYRSGAMRRRDTVDESGRMVFTTFAHCERRSGFIVDWDAREYRSYKWPQFWPSERIREHLDKNPQSAVQVESRTVDTGERKMFFGHQAKHLITTIKQSGSSGIDGEEIIDGWYIDHDVTDNDCAPDFFRSEPFYALGTILVTYPQFPVFHHIGTLPPGLAVKLTRTSRIGAKDGGAARTITSEETIEEISDSSLKPSTFDLPSGLRENPRLLRGK